MKIKKTDDRIRKKFGQTKKGGAKMEGGGG